jgi:hypothetical protein
MGRECSTNERKSGIHIGRILMEKPKGKRQLENQGVGGWTILKWILER